MIEEFDIKKIEKPKKEPVGEEIHGEKFVFRKEKPGLGSKIPYILLFILIGLLLYGLYLYFQSSETEQKPKEVNLEEMAEVPKTATEEVKQEETTPPSPAPAFEKEKVSIQVLNGSGIRGQAEEVKSLLEKDGWKVATFGNAGSFKYQNTIVYYKEGQEEAGKKVEEYLKSNNFQTSLEKSDTLTKYDVLVVTGKK